MTATGATTGSPERARPVPGTEPEAPPYVNAPGTSRLLRELSTLSAPAIVLLALLEVATRWQAGHRELLLAGVGVILTQVVPGALLWRTVRPQHGWWVEDLSMGFSLGAALAVPSQVAAAWSGQRSLTGGLPLAVAALLLLAPVSRTRIMSRECRPLPWLWGALVAVACALPVANVLQFYRQPLRWLGAATPYVDLPYHLALAGEVSHHFPPHYPQLAQDTLYYHWFSHAWMAQVSAVSGTPLDVVLLRFMPALLAVAVPVATACVAMRVASNVWAGPVSGLIAFGVVDFDVWGIGSSTLPMSGPASPTQGFAILVLLPLLALLTMRWRGLVPAGSYLLLAPLTIVAGGAKGSVLPVVVFGMVGAVTMQVVHRYGCWRRVLLDATTAMAVLAVLMGRLFGGGAGGTEASLLSTGLQDRARASFSQPTLHDTALVLATLFLLLPTFLGAVPGLRVLTGRDSRQDPVAWFLLGCSAAGGAAILFLDHPGFAQYYFLRTAELPLSLLAGWGLVVLLDRSTHPIGALGAGVLAGVVGVLVARWWPGPLAESGRPALTAAAALAVFILVAAAVAALSALPSPGRRDGAGQWRAAGAAVMATAFSVAGSVPAVHAATRPLPSTTTYLGPGPGAITSSQVRAARWIRDHSAEDDVVMTNQHCRTGRGPHCDHRSFFVSAYAERRVLIEGWAYTKTSNQLGAAHTGISGNTVAYWRPGLLRLNDDFLVRPSARSAARLFKMGVRWAYVSARAPRASDLAPFAQEEFRTRDVVVYRLHGIASE